MKPKRALISVWDKTGIVEFAHELAALNIEILATGETAKTLKGAGIKVLEVSDWTKSPEILGGRVKTLHPKIAAGILSYRKESDIEPIDIVVCNLYPFESFLIDKLTIEEMNALVNQLFTTKEPYFCPHGRPVIVTLELEELDRKFKRIK